MAIWLVELELTAPGGATSMLYLSYPEIPPFGPDDPDRPNQAYDPVLFEPANVEISLPSDIARGVGDIGGGAVVIGNADRRYAGLDGYAITRIVSLVGPDDATTWAEFTPVLDGIGDAPDVDPSTARASRVVVPVADERAILEQYAQDDRYTGDPEELYQGTADDIAGAALPLSLGDLGYANVPGVVVATAPKIVMQLSGVGFAALDTVYVSGGPGALTDAGDFVGAAFDAEVPDSGEIITDKARGLVKFADTPTGEATFDLAGPAGVGLTARYGAALDAAPALLEWLLRRWGVPGSRIGSTFADIDEPAAVAIYTGTEDVRRRDLVDLLCRSFNGWCVPDANRVWQVGRRALPAGEPVLTLREDDVFSVEADSWGYPIPIAGCVVQWGRNYRVMRGSDVAGAVRTGDPARTGWLGEAYRQVTADAEGVAAAWRGAVTPTLQTALVSATDAQALADDVVALYGAPRRPRRVATPLRPEVWALPFGAHVAIEHSDPTIAGSYVLVGRRPTAPTIQMMTLRLWGAMPEPEVGE